MLSKSIRKKTERFITFEGTRYRIAADWNLPNGLREDNREFPRGIPAPPKVPESVESEPEPPLIELESIDVDVSSALREIPTDSTSERRGDETVNTSNAFTSNTKKPKVERIEGLGSWSKPLPKENTPGLRVKKSMLDIKLTGHDGDPVPLNIAPGAFALAEAMYTRGYITKTGAVSLLEDMLCSQAK